MTQVPPYRSLQQATTPVAEASVAELHGAMAGMLCAAIDATYEHWRAALFGEDAVPLAQQADEPLRALFAVTRRDLTAADLSFELLLPDDDETLAVRAQALGSWCAGFLFGLGQTIGAQAWTDDTSELLKDFAEIARLDTADDDDTDTEDDYVEIAEFVRVGVQLIRSECEVPARKRLH